MSKKFDVDQFRHILQTSWLGSEFIYLEKTDSTNSYLKGIPSSDLSHGTVVLADHQLKGRGQYERKWEAEPFKNLTFTVAFRPNVKERLNLLSIGIAYSITKTLEPHISESKQVCLKWPNDILVDGKKLGGVLTECIFNGSRTDRVLIGFGLNVGQSHFSNGVKETAISFNEVSDSTLSREELLNELLLGMENIYQRWYKRDETLKKDISKKLVGYGEWVQVSINGVIPNQKFKFIGINSNGELMMLNQQLDVNTFTYEQVRIIPDSEGISATEAGPSVSTQ
ncbi:biotin--[acetyl-CoA-carboxylase] ligase [Rhodohalobacter sp. 614A]|uniref:biotin--[acetyl-CoA-carboxylase] ligase n=1 Tax=Rhodohalobacter sp. 614A TaxID=2908649 RepID=UPI001F197C60|nr:biotin--[acetyl-CoA-carboxylase] ligase [Rhodohalobacter sp. 614A]